MRDNSRSLSPFHSGHDIRTDGFGYAIVESALADIVETSTRAPGGFIAIEDIADQREVRSWWDDGEDFQEEFLDALIVLLFDPKFGKASRRPSEPIIRKRAHKGNRTSHGLLRVSLGQKREIHPPRGRKFVQLKPAARPAPKAVTTRAPLPQAPRKKGPTDLKVVRHLGARQ